MYHIFDGIVMGKKNPSCIIEGYTGDTVCRFCNEMLKTGTEIDALEEHDDVQNVYHNVELPDEDEE